MRRRILRWTAGILAGLSVCLAAIVVAAIWRADRTFHAPAPDLRAVADPETIARGRYLVQGPAHCADCHAPPSQKPRVDAGLEADLSGGYVLKTFLGEMRAPNITSDTATGIGGITDAELARFFRFGIDHRSQVGLPLMMYADLSDRDLIAVLSYLRTLPPISHAVPPSSYNILGKITKAYFLEPFAPAPDTSISPLPGVTREYGGYLAKVVANCASCHTARNMKTGEYTGPPFAGGLVFRKSDDPGQVMVSPNLTPDPQTGAIAGWSRERFIERMRRGDLRGWSPMPWGPYARMSDADLEAIHLFLLGLEPIHRENRPPK